MSHYRIIKVAPFFSGAPGRQGMREFVVTYQVEGRAPTFVIIPAEKVLKKGPSGVEETDMPALEKEIVLRDTASSKIEGHTFQA